MGIYENFLIFPKGFLGPFNWRGQKDKLTYRPYVFKGNYEYDKKVIQFKKDEKTPVVYSEKAGFSFLRILLGWYLLKDKQWKVKVGEILSYNNLTEVKIKNNQPR